MKIPKIPYVNDVLGQLLYVLLTGGECSGYEEIPVNASQPFALNVPEGTVYALVVCEADPTHPVKTKVVRYKQSDTQNNPPSASVGLPLGELGVVEIKGTSCLNAFRAIGIDNGYTHLLRVEYYS